MQVKFKKVRDGAVLPRRGHAIDVGLDVFTPTEGVLKPGMNIVPLGLTCEVPVGYGGFIYPRSGMVSGVATKKLEASPYSVRQIGTERVEAFYPGGVSLVAHLPPIDPGYTGEINAFVYNHSDLYIKYPQHTRFGQLVFYPIAYATPVEEVDLSRKDGAMNSTGEAGDFRR